MRENSYKPMIENQNRVVFLENKLNFVLETAEYISEGKLEEAKQSTKNYKESAAYLTFSTLIEKFEECSTRKPHPDDKSYQFLKIVLECMPFPVFIKDEKSRYLLLNSHELELFGLDEKDVLGKHDRDFVHDEEEMAIIQSSDDAVLKEKRSIELPTQNFSLPNGKSYVFKTHKIPFTNPITGKTNLLGFSIEISDTVNLDKLKKILIINGPYL